MPGRIVLRLNHNLRLGDYIAFIKVSNCKKKKRREKLLFFFFCKRSKAGLEMKKRENSKLNLRSLTQ